MNASDIMTSPVISAGPDSTVRDIAALLLKHRISAVPVLENGKLVGIVSEADLLHRYEIGTESRSRSRAWWLRLLTVEDGVSDYVKSHARHARDVMTTEVVTVTADTPVPDIATLLERHRVKRVPVVEDGRLVGIVSRSNLVQALAAKGREIGAGASGDGEIRSRLTAELERHAWWGARISNVIVTDGVVHYFGTVDREEEKQAARVAAENVPGVRRVEDHRLPISAYAWSV